MLFLFILTFSHNKHITEQSPSTELPNDWHCTSLRTKFSQWIVRIKYNTIEWFAFAPFHFLYGQSTRIAVRSRWEQLQHSDRLPILLDFHKLRSDCKQCNF